MFNFQLLSTFLPATSLDSSISYFQKLNFVCFAVIDTIHLNFDIDSVRALIFFEKDLSIDLCFIPIVFSFLPFSFASLTFHHLYLWIFVHSSDAPSWFPIDAEVALNFSVWAVHSFLLVSPFLLPDYLQLSLLFCWYLHFYS